MGTEHGLTIRQAPDRELHVYATDQNGGRMVHVQFFAAQDGDWIPTGEGLELTPGAAHEVAEALEAVTNWRPVRVVDKARESLDRKGDGDVNETQTERKSWRAGITTGHGGHAWCLLCKGRFDLGSAQIVVVEDVCHDGEQDVEHCGEVCARCLLKTPAEVTNALLNRAVALEKEAAWYRELAKVGLKLPSREEFDKAEADIERQIYGLTSEEAQARPGAPRAA